MGVVVLAEVKDVTATRARLALRPRVVVEVNHGAVTSNELDDLRSLLEDEPPWLEPPVFEAWLPEPPTFDELTAPVSLVPPCRTPLRSRSTSRPKPWSASPNNRIPHHPRVLIQHLQGTVATLQPELAHLRGIQQ